MEAGGTGREDMYCRSEYLDPEVLFGRRYLKIVSVKGGTTTSGRRHGICEDYQFQLHITSGDGGIKGRFGSLKSDKITSRPKLVA